MGIGIGVVAVTGPAPVVSAHAIVTTIEPADGSALLAAPGQVVVTFSEPMLADGLAAEITAPNAATTPVVTAGLDAGDPTRVVVRLGTLGEGSYQVRVTARDAEDLHLVVARTSFAIGQAAPAPSAPVISGPEPIETGARWIFAAGLALLIGVTAVRTRWPDVPIDRPRRLRSLALVGIALAFAGRLGVLVARIVSLGGPPLDAARTVIGTTDARRLALVVLALGCVAMIEQPRRAIWLDVPLRSNGHLTCRQALSWFGVINLAVIAGWGGHSALDGSIEPIAVLAKSAHLVGLGLWVGVLAVVLAVSSGATTRRSALVAMSQVALLGAVLTVVSGLVLASRLVVSVTALASTPYGVMLTVKIVLIAGAIALGATMQRAHRSRTSFGELAVLATVVLLGAAMATATPAIDRGFTDVASTEPTLQPAVAADDLLLQIRAIPAHPGANSLELRIGETRRPSPGVVTEVEVRSGDAVTTALPTEGGLVFIDGVDLPAGESPVQVIVHRRDWPDTTARLGVATDVPAWVHAPVVSSARLRAPLLALAAAIAVVAGLVLRRRSVRPRASARQGHVVDRPEAVTSDDAGMVTPAR